MLGNIPRKGRPDPLRVVLAGLMATAPSWGAVEIVPPSGQVSWEAQHVEISLRNKVSVFEKVKITQGEWTVVADKVEATELAPDNDSDWHLQGSIRISAPGTEINAQTGTIEIRGKHIQTIHLTGTPATLEHQLKPSNDVVHGRANTMDYDFKHSLIRLSGETYLAFGEYEVSGKSLLYDLGQQKVLSDPMDKSDDRVRILKKTP